MIEYATAKELAQHVADAEAKHLNAHESYVIVDDSVDTFPWGWVFEPAMEPYRTTGNPCLYAGAWCISVDRFSGKIQTGPWTEYRDDQWPIVELVLTDTGSDSTTIYHFLRQYKGWAAIETRNNMESLPIVVAAGSNTSVSPVGAALTERGATVLVRQKNAGGTDRP